MDGEVAHCACRLQDGVPVAASGCTRDLEERDVSDGMGSAADFFHLSLSLLASPCRKKARTSIYTGVVEVVCKGRGRRRQGWATKYFQPRDRRRAGSVAIYHLIHY